MCRCECGTESAVWQWNLARGMSTQCQKCQYKAISKGHPGMKVNGNTLTTSKNTRFRLNGLNVWKCDACAYTRTLSHPPVGCRKCSPKKVSDKPSKRTRILTHPKTSEKKSISGWASVLGLSRWGMCLRVQKYGPDNPIIFEPSTKN